MKRGLFWLALFALACRAAADAAPTAVPASSPIVEKDVAYAASDNPAQTLDIYYPAGETAAPHPVMIFVHGGAWVIGDKFRVEVKDDAFTQAGYIFISLNYRMSPEVDWREMAADVAAAVAWTQTNIAERGGDPAAIFLMGHSAGAHLAALTATDESYLQGAGADLDALKGVVVLDTQAYNIPALAGDDGRLPALYAQIFGDDPQAWTAASPLAHVAPGKDIPPMALAWSKGLRGDNAAAREAAAREFAGALQNAGVPFILVDGSDKTHAEINRQFGEPDDALTKTIMDWLSQQE